MKGWRAALLSCALAGGAALPACADTLAKAAPNAAAVADAKAAPPAPAILDEGEATWYGGYHAGRRTSSGETFNPARMTAAHPTLPLGTIIRVTDEATGRSVVVRVNDREPPHGSRCIDLSEGAARVLGIRSRGVADVEITQASADEMVEVAEAPEPRATGRHGRRHTRRAAR